MLFAEPPNRMWTPSPLLPEMTFRSAAFGPPMESFDELVMKMPSEPFGLAFVPVGSRPMY
jgi:hypothetical protein